MHDGRRRGRDTRAYPHLPFPLLLGLCDFLFHLVIAVVTMATIAVSGTRWYPVICGPRLSFTRSPRTKRILEQFLDHT